MDDDGIEVCICSECLSTPAVSEEEIERLCVERGCSEDVGDPLAFVGSPMSPAMIWIEERDPTKEDLVDGDGDRFEIGGTWINKKTHTVWMLKCIKNKEASWLRLTIKEKHG